MLIIIISSDFHSGLLRYYNNTKIPVLVSFLAPASPDYPSGAIHEALVSAIVHRDYMIQGSEIYIDMYDDRLEIVSPGGMTDGKRIQDLSIDDVASIRRNPVICDLF